MKPKTRKDKLPKRLNRGTNEALRYLYLRFNKRWFHNALPKDMPVSFRKIGTLGQTIFHSQTNRPLYIQISEKFRFTQSGSALTLLHEMVHVELKHVRGHSKPFHKRMTELAKAGAFKKYW